MSNITDDYVYEIPNSTLSIPDILYQLPMDYTGGLYINIWLFGLYGILFIGSLQFQMGVRKAGLFTSFGGFVVTFLLTLAGFAGTNQLIPATVVLIGAIFINHLQSGGARL